ncbi:SsrA-binding protein SmpB [Aquihabitans sp. G128]|uniref:SsrA-binding protein SmpB n=1 Tax=Aquihabitans sp. G128 TaxID=2849779 RepID=UPI001C238A4F|nr:SsrA-binding protein SmpB [Aquihabitans sp. G128]QXC62773.1 SsrA-binding protein SmpB [Aquihabitans sp. G128]
MAAKRPDSRNKIVATNRQARRDYEILDTWECGIMLQGSEVKSLREAKVTLTDAYARVDMREIYLVGLHINAYSSASAQGGHELSRTRKLLLHRHEIDELRLRVDQEHLSLIPLQLYFKEGRAKLELGLGRGRKHYDKRQVIAKRDADMDARRAMAARRRTG